jgi:hypothetical protein
MPTKWTMPSHATTRQLKLRDFDQAAKGRNDTLNEAFKVWRVALAAARS